MLDDRGIISLMVLETDRINQGLAARWPYLERERVLRWSRYWHNYLWSFAE